MVPMRGTFDCRTFMRFQQLKRKVSKKMYSFALVPVAEDRFSILNKDFKCLCLKLREEIQFTCQNIQGVPDVMAQNIPFNFLSFSFRRLVYRGFCA